MTWWESLDDYLTEREKSDADVPDPWGDIDLGEPALTDEQVAYLAFDQPGVPRLRGLTPPAFEDEPSGEGTGNSPGDD